jgi:hypothetical protein
MNIDWMNTAVHTVTHTLGAKQQPQKNTRQPLMNNSFTKKDVSTTITYNDKEWCFLCGCTDVLQVGQV